MKTLSIQTVLRVLPRSLAICALSASGLLAAPSASFACKCAAPPSATEALAQASAVFEAQVAQVTPTESDLEVSLRVVRAWKGVDGETIRVRTRRDTAACGIPFEMGKSYLVYASQTTAQPSAIALEALRCGRTRPAEEAAEDFVELGLGVVPVAAREPATDPSAAAPTGPAASPSPPSAAPKPPAAGGCASCNAARASSDRTSLAMSALAALAFVLRSRRPARRPR